MAHELNMSLTGYLHIKDILVPKHLAVSQLTRKKQALRKDFLRESPSGLAQQNKIKNMKPIAEVEAIMRHFDAKFNNERPRQRPFLEGKKPRKGSQEDEGSREGDLEQRMNHLLKLPVLGNIRRQAQRYRTRLHAEEIRERQQRKADIMQNFKHYMKAELKGSQESGRKRFNTIN